MVIPSELEQGEGVTVAPVAVQAALEVAAVLKRLKAFWSERLDSLAELLET